MSKVTARYERESARRASVSSTDDGQGVCSTATAWGWQSSRRIAQRLHEDIAFRVLAANNTPDFRTISDFRKDNAGCAVGHTFVQVLALCSFQAGLVKLRRHVGAGGHEGQGQRIEA